MFITLAGIGPAIWIQSTKSYELFIVGTSLNFSSTTAFSFSTFLVSVSMVSSANLHRQLAAMYLPDTNRIEYYSALQLYWRHKTDKEAQTYFSFAAVIRLILCCTSCSAAASFTCSAPSSCFTSYTVCSTACSFCSAFSSLLAPTCGEGEVEVNLRICTLQATK